MKVGDLVTLSQYGKSVRRTQWIRPDDIGIVKDVRNSIWLTYEVMWNNSTYPGWSPSGYELVLDRRDLKFVK